MSPSAPVSFRNHEQRSDATPFPYPTPLDILRPIILRSCHRLFVVKTWSQQQSIVHPMRIRGHEHLRFVSHCREYIIVLCSWDPGHRPPSPPSTREVERAPLRWTSAGANISERDCRSFFLGGETERDDEFSIEPSVSSPYGIDMIALSGMSRSGSKIEITEREIGPGRTGRGQQGQFGDSPGCNVRTNVITDSNSGAEAGRNENSGKNVCG